MRWLLSVLLSRRQSHLRETLRIDGRRRRRRDNGLLRGRLGRGVWIEGVCRCLRRLRVLLM